MYLVEYYSMLCMLIQGSEDDNTSDLVIDLPQVCTTIDSPQHDNLTIIT